MSVQLCADLCSVKMVKHGITQTTNCDNLGTLVLSAKDLMKFEWGHPQSGNKYRWDRLILVFFNQYFAISQKQCKKDLGRLI